jgi:hypothetical protein
MATVSVGSATGLDLVDVSVEGITETGMLSDSTVSYSFWRGGPPCSGCRATLAMSSTAAR